MSRRFSGLACLMLALGCIPAAGADAPLALGVAAPLSGPSATLGAQVLAGARAAAAKAGAGAIVLTSVDDACTAEGGRAAAQALVAAKVRAVVGFLCTNAIQAAMPAFKAANIPVITVGVRADSLTDDKLRTGWPVVRLGPRDDSEQAAAGRILAGLWRDELFAIVDDGTIYGRELAESVRAAMEEAALKPVFTDTYRPGSDNQIALVERLRKAGATHVFAGGEREDVAVMTRDAAARNAGLVFAGGEALRADPGGVALAPGTLMIGLPEWADIADPAASAAVRAAGSQPAGYALPAFAAVETAAQALKGQPAEATPAVRSFIGRTFPTALGLLGFDAKGDLSANPYRALRFDGMRFVPAENP